MGCNVGLIPNYFQVFQFNENQDDDDDGSEIINESVINVVVTGQEIWRLKLPHRQTSQHQTTIWAKIVPTTTALVHKWKQKNSIRPTLISFISCVVLYQQNLVRMRIAFVKSMILVSSDFCQKLDHHDYVPMMFGQFQEEISSVHETEPGCLR